MKLVYNIIVSYKILKALAGAIDVEKLLEDELSEYCNQSIMY